MEFKATPPFQLPATEIEFKVPVTGLEVVPSGAPGPNQIGYTAVAADTLVVGLTSGVKTAVQSLTLDVGTWLLTANAIVKSTNAATDITQFSVSLEDLVAATELSKVILDNIGTIGNTRQYGTGTTAVVQLSGPTTIELNVFAAFTNTLEMVALPSHTFLHATRLS